MASRATDMNLQRLLTNIHASHPNVGSRVVASFDIEKAFDTLEWLRRMDFPMVKWLQVLYRHPTAAVKMGGGLSSFSLFRGLDRAALFAIAMEPVAEALCTSPNIKWLQIDWLEERVALYADGLLLFLNDAGPSLQGVCRHWTLFQRLLG